MKNPLNFFKHWKKHGLKKTVEEWRYQFVMLDTPEGLTKKEAIGYSGALIGGIWGIIYYLLQGNWGFMILLAGISLVFYSQMKGKLKQLQMLKDMKERFEDTMGAA